MNNTKKVQLLYYFTEYTIEYGLDVERKNNAKKTIDMFIEEWTENFNDKDYFDRDELPMFAESLEDLEKAKKYLYEILGVQI